eukprot:jgi/Hompol1/808/HPOL_004512-RA
MTVTVKKRKFQQNADPNDVLTTVNDFGQKYHCDACNKDITYLVRLKCAECVDFDLCVECFAAGSELKDHQRSHPYRVFEMLDFPIFEADWGADEELLLVEGLELHGVGNWEQISEHVGTKNKIECAEHYDRLYIQSDIFPYPVRCICKSSEFLFNHNNKLPNYPSRNHCRHSKELSHYHRLLLLLQPISSGPANHDIAGYMPGRKEFELEFDNDAEQAIKDMEFMEDDSREEIDLKCAMLNIYNTTLDRRAERKKFIFDRHLTDFKRIQMIEKKRPKEEKELFQKMRVFAKMMTAQDFDMIMEGLVAEVRLRQRIAQLQEYRRFGIKTMREVAEFERERATHASNKSAGLTGFAIERSASRRTKTEEGGNLMASPAHSITSALQAAQSRPPIVAPTTAMGGSTLHRLVPTATAPQMPSNRPLPLDIRNADGIDLLSENEQYLCSNLRLFPHAYLSIKSVILKEYAAKGTLTRRQARTLVKIDVNKTGCIFDFFVEMGWISLK